MYVLLTHFGDASGPAALGINLQAFIVQLLTFLVVFLALKKWAFGPIIKMLNERRDTIEQGVTLGEQMRAEREKMGEEVAKALHEARGKADELVAAAESEAKQRVVAAEDTAQKRADGILEEAQVHIKQAAARERARLEKEVVGLVSEVSEAIIGEKVDAQKDAAMIERALKGQKAA